MSWWDVPVWLGVGHGVGGYFWWKCRTAAGTAFKGDSGACSHVRRGGEVHGEGRENAEEKWKLMFTRSASNNEQNQGLLQGGLRVLQPGVLLFCFFALLLTSASFQLLSQPYFIEKGSIP